ncbi:hypothetical protein [Chloroflexus sp.]|nr:hypothetical protein [Chloroflexus sp.]
MSKPEVRNPSGERSTLVLCPVVIGDTPPPQPAPAGGESLWCDPTVAI